MPKSESLVPPQIALGDEDAVVSRSGQSRKVVAKILGRGTDPRTGRQIIWLDRLVHRRGEDVFLQGEQAWDAVGAISTVLTERATVGSA